MSCADGGRLRVGGMRVCAGGGGVGGAEEDDSVVSLRCTPAYGSEVGVCDAGFVGMAEAMPFRVGVGL